MLLTDLRPRLSQLPPCAIVCYRPRYVSLLGRYGNIPSLQKANRRRRAIAIITNATMLDRVIYSRRGRYLRKTASGALAVGIIRSSLFRMRRGLSRRLNWRSLCTQIGFSGAVPTRVL